MLNRYLTYYKPAIQFVVFCAIVSMSLFIGSFIIEILTIKMTGIGPVELNEIKTISTDLAAKLKITNAATVLIILLLPALLFAYLAHPSPARYLNLTFDVKPRHWILAILLIVLSIPVGGMLEEWSKFIPAIGNSRAMDEQYDRMANAMLQVSRLQDFGANILFICFIPALVEEIFFRGCLQQILLSRTRHKPWIALWLVAILFSAFHWQLSGFFPRLFLGLMLGYAAYWTGSIWVSILLHFLNNLLSVVLYFLCTRQLINKKWLDMPPNIWLTVSCGMLLIFVMYYFNRHKKPYVVPEVEKDELTL